ncbi:MAG: hypothetical protein ACYC7J_18490 [Syntrophales bacterium]
MECQKCGKDLNDETATITAGFASHDPSKVEVSVICNGCEGSYNGFLSLDEMVFYE